MVDIPNKYENFDQGFISHFDSSVQLDQRWMNTRLQEMPVVIALPNFSAIQWNSLFSWEQGDIENEQRLSQVCRTSGMLGLNSNEFVTADHLVDLPPILDRKNLGWSARQISQIQRRGKWIDSLHSRRCAAAGWLICHSYFMEDQEILKNEWLQLPKAVRPEMPLWRSGRLPEKHQATQNARKSKRLDFQKYFDQFCDRWRMTGMITWEVPVPDGPKWPDNKCVQDTVSQSGSTELNTPFHFAIQTKDDVGKYAKQNHEELAEKRGVSDLSQWKTYSQLMRLSFWEQVLDQRYSESPRIKSYQTVKVGLLEDVLGLDRERILKLRRTLSEFRRRKRVSLARFR